MRLKILATLVSLLAVLVGMVYWRTYFSATHMARRPLAVLKQEALAGGTPAVQQQAAVELTEYAGDPTWNSQALAALREVAEKGLSSAVKAAAMDGLRRANDWESLPVIFTLMDDESTELRGRAGVAAKELVGADYGFQASDPPAKRRAIIRDMRDYYEKLNSAKLKHENEPQP